MELGAIFPSYNKLLRIDNAKVARDKINKSKREQAADAIKPKSASTSISQQSNERIVDVSI